MNSLPCSKPWLRASHATAVQLDHARTSDRPIPKPPCVRSSDGVTWEEHSEQSRQMFRGDARSVVAQGDDRLIALPAR